MQILQEIHRTRSWRVLGLPTIWKVRQIWNPCQRRKCRLKVHLPPPVHKLHLHKHIRQNSNWYQPKERRNKRFIHTTKWIPATSTSACWRVDVENDAHDDDNKYTGYFVYEGERYYQTAVSIWICPKGILSLYPGGTGWTLDGTKSREFREDMQSKFNTSSFTPSMWIQNNNKVFKVS